MPHPSPRVVALSGGVGGARLAHGLALALPPERLTVVVNTGDDFRPYGLAVCPDLDTVLYTLAGRADATRGWGISDDTDRVLAALRALGDPAWFQLGDQDLATHLVRTARLAAGDDLTAVTGHLAAALGLRCSVLPATDDPVATIIDTVEGARDFQTWFVRQRCAPPATAVAYRGADAARPTDAVLAAIAAAELIVLGPSNPYLSIGPMLALPGFRAALAAAPIVAVSPIIAGQALKGPTADMMRSFAGAADCVQLAHLYGELLAGLVIDTADRSQVPDLERLGLAVHVTDILVPAPDDRRRLAAEVLAFGAGLRRAS